MKTTEQELLSAYRSLSQSDQRFLNDLLDRFASGEISEDELSAILQKEIKNSKREEVL